MALDNRALSIWARPEPGSRRPRFSRDQIAAAALEIADHEGFDAVSMRRIASELGAGTMTLYHYIRTKDELVSLMHDALMAEALAPPEELSAGWRYESLGAVARKARSAFLRHPWAMPSLMDAQSGLNAKRRLEQSLGAVADTELDDRSKLELLAWVDDYVFGNVINAKSRRAVEVSDDQALEAGVEKDCRRC